MLFNDLAIGVTKEDISKLNNLFSELIKLYESDKPDITDDDVYNYLAQEKQIRDKIVPLLWELIKHSCKEATKEEMI
jgi:hypothetical protein